MKKKINGTANHFITSKGEFFKGNVQLSTNRKDHSGKPLVSINGRSMRVAHLMAEHFLPEEYDRLHITYKDGDLTNVSKGNLSWSYQQFFSKQTIRNRKKKFKQHMGKNHWKSRPFKAEGRIYHTLREASESLKTILPTIQKRLKSKNRKDYFYL